MIIIEVNTMKIANQISEIIKHNESSTGQLATQLGQSHSNLLNKLSRDNLRINELEEIAHALGYTQMEIVLHGHEENAIIRNEMVKFVEHTKYLTTNASGDLNDEFQTYGINNIKFKDMVFDLLEESIKDNFGELWDTTVPKRFEEGFKDAIRNGLPDIDKKFKVYTSDNNEED